MKTQMRNQRQKSRKMGAMLMDAALAIGILMMIIVMMAINNQRESQSQQDRLTAARMEMFANMSKAYVGEQYDAIREELVDGSALPGSVAATILTMDDLVDAGYVSGSLLSTTSTDAFGQEYRLFIRAVLRSDPNFPQATLTTSDIAVLNGPDLNGVPTLLNGIFSATDDEMDLEAVLLSEGGTPIPLRRGPNITANSGNPTMGYIMGDAGDLTAGGNLGAFQMPLAPWIDLGAAPQAGGLLTLISLSDGNTGGGGANASANIRGALRRCDDLTDPAQKEQCLADGNNMYSSIVFSNVSGQTPDFDQYPGIEGLKKIACREGDADGRPTGPIDETFDVIYLDCGNVVLSENLTLQDGDLMVQQGDLSVENGTIILNGNEIGDNLIMASGEGTNLSTLPATPLTEICPLRADGTQMTYRVQAWVSNIIEPVGRPLAGYRMTTPTLDASNQFEVDVISFVNEDFCENVDPTGTLLTPNNTDKDMDFGDFAGQVFMGSGSRCGANEGEAGDGDGFPDAYYLNPGQAQIQYAIYCE